MVRPLRAALVVATVVTIAIAAGCGSSSSSSADSTPTSTPATTAPASTAPTTTAAAASTAPTTTAGSTIAVAIAADPSGALTFVQKTLTAPAGSVTFNFTNTSPVPHNLTFEKAGTEKELGATKTIASGSASLTLTLAKGTYAYYCSVAGHEAAGMKGTLTVT